MHEGGLYTVGHTVVQAVGLRRKPGNGVLGAFRVHPHRARLTAARSAQPSVRLVSLKGHMKVRP
jgi:hypothetical protein